MYTNRRMLLGDNGEKVHTQSLLYADFISIGFESPAGQTYASAADLGKLMTLIFSNDKPLNPQEGQVWTIRVLYT